MVGEYCSSLQKVRRYANGSQSWGTLSSVCGRAHPTWKDPVGRNALFAGRRHHMLYNLEVLAG